LKYRDQGGGVLVLVRGGWYWELKEKKKICLCAMIALTFLKSLYWYLLLLLY